MVLNDHVAGYVRALLLYRPKTRLEDVTIGIGVGDCCTYEVRVTRFDVPYRGDTEYKEVELEYPETPPE